VLRKKRHQGKVGQALHKEARLLGQFGAGGFDTKSTVLRNLEPSKRGQAGVKEVESNWARKRKEVESPPLKSPQPQPGKQTKKGNRWGCYDGNERNPPETEKS